MTTRFIAYANNHSIPILCTTEGLEPDILSRTEAILHIDWCFDAGFDWTFIADRGISC